VGSGIASETAVWTMPDYDIQLNLFEPVSIKEVCLIVPNSPGQTFYNIRIETYHGQYLVKKESGTRGKVWDKRSWTFDFFEDADKYFKRRIKEKTNRNRKSPRKYEVGILKVPRKRIKEELEI
jgi:hypothetical protein